MKSKVELSDMATNVAFLAKEAEDMGDNNLEDLCWYTSICGIPDVENKLDDLYLDEYYAEWIRVYATYVERFYEKDVNALFTYLANMLNDCRYRLILTSYLNKADYEKINEAMQKVACFINENKLGNHAEELLKVISFFNELDANLLAKAYDICSECREYLDERYFYYRELDGEYYESNEDDVLSKIDSSDSGFVATSFKKVGTYVPWAEGLKIYFHRAEGIAVATIYYFNKKNAKSNLITKKYEITLDELSAAKLAEILNSIAKEVYIA